MNWTINKRLLLTFLILILWIFWCLVVYHYRSFYSGGETDNKISITGQTFKKYSYEIITQDFENIHFPPKNSTSGMQSTTVLDDVFISVKTTGKNHYGRLLVILKTWFPLANNQTWFFTDIKDPDLQRKTNGHMIKTDCPSSHASDALACKLSVEFDTYLSTNKKWFCHFDDDNYVNVPRLVQFLGNYDPREDWYLGKPSLQTPLEIDNEDGRMGKIKFWFATGGAGFCLSQALTLKMLPIAGNGKFRSIAKKIRKPDDITMGYIIVYLMKIPLTVVDQFHSHHEVLKLIQKDMLQNQISLSFKRSKTKFNVVEVDGFDKNLDPSRFLSLHCFLFQHTNFCRIREKSRRSGQN